MWISRYLLYFVITGFMGWVYETTFTLLKDGKWENRGFLYGPICPIYGVGAVTLMFIYHTLMSDSRIDLTWWGIFLLSFFGSMVLEYITSWGLEKWFHTLWWDYSNMPLNVHGRICLPASLGFGAAGLLIVYFIDPFVHEITGWIPPIWIEALGLLFVGMLSVDLALTISALTYLDKTILQLNEKINKHMDAFAENIKGKKQFVENNILKERERAIRENVKQALQYDNVWSRRSVLQRVKKYRHPKIESVRIEQLIKEINAHLKKN